MFIWFLRLVTAAGSGRHERNLSYRGSGRTQIDHAATCFINGIDDSGRGWSAIEDLRNGGSADATPEARLGAGLREVRVQAGISVRRLARDLDRAHSTISDFENGRRLPGVEVVEQYEDYFGLPRGTLGAQRERARAARLESPLDATVEENLGDVVCPYLGLRAFESADAALFFGRETEVREVLARLDEARFVAVVGASGSGKSSFVRAGLLAYISAASNHGGADPRVGLLTPGQHPVQALASAVSAVSGVGVGGDIGRELARPQRPRQNRDVQSRRAHDRVRRRRQHRPAVDADTYRQRGGALRGHSFGVISAAFSRDGRILASAGYDGTIRLWDVRLHQPLGKPLTGHAGPLTSVSFGPDRHILAVRAFNRILLWNVRTHQPIAAFRARLGAPTSNVVFSPDGRTLAAATDAGPRLWSVRTHARLPSPLHVRGAINVAFSPDGGTLATTTFDRVVLWNTRTRRQTGALQTDGRSGVSTLAFSHDGRVLAGGTFNGVVLWNARTLQQIGAPLTTHTAPINGVAFAPRGRTLASASDDNAIWLRTVPPRKQPNAPLLWRNLAELKSSVCRLSGGGMSRTEWTQYASGIPFRNSCR